MPENVLPKKQHLSKRTPSKIQLVTNAGRMATWREIAQNLVIIINSVIHVVKMVIWLGNVITPVNRKEIATDVENVVILHVHVKLPSE